MIRNSSTFRIAGFDLHRLKQRSPLLFPVSDAEQSQVGATGGASRRPLGSVGVVLELDLDVRRRSPAAPVAVVDPLPRHRQEHPADPLELFEVAEARGSSRTLLMPRRKMSTTVADMLLVAESPPCRSSGSSIPGSTIIVVVLLAVGLLVRVWKLTSPSAT